MVLVPIPIISFDTVVVATKSYSSFFIRLTYVADLRRELDET